MDDIHEEAIIGQISCTDTDTDDPEGNSYTKDAAPVYTYANIYNAPSSSYQPPVEVRKRSLSSQSEDSSSTAKGSVHNLSMRGRSISSHSEGGYSPHKAGIYCEAESEDTYNKRPDEHVIKRSRGVSYLSNSTSADSGETDQEEDDIPPPIKKPKNVASNIMVSTIYDLVFSYDQSFIISPVLRLSIQEL